MKLLSAEQERVLECHDSAIDFAAGSGGVAIVASPPGTHKSSMMMYRAIRDSRNGAGTVIASRSKELRDEAFLRHQNLATSLGQRPPLVRIQAFDQICPIAFDREGNLSRKGYSYSEIACADCPQVEGCPAKGQIRSVFRDEAIVHATHRWLPALLEMGILDKKTLIIEGRPFFVDTVRLGRDEILDALRCRITPVRRTLRAIDPALQRLLDALDAAQEAKWKEPHPLYVTGPHILDFFGPAAGNVARELLEAADWLSNSDLPIPKPDEIRQGRVIAHLPRADLPELLRAIGHEIRASADERSAACIVVTRSSKQGRRTIPADAWFEIRFVNAPPREHPVVVLDGTAGVMELYYRAFFKDRPLEWFSLNCSPPPVSPRAVHLKLSSATKSRLVRRYDGQVRDSAFGPIARALIAGCDACDETRGPVHLNDPPRTIALVAPQPVVEAIEIAKALCKPQVPRPGAPKKPRRLMQRISKLLDDIRVRGYFEIEARSFTASELARDVADADVTLVLTDQTPAVGSAIEDARALGLAAPDTSHDWKSGEHILLPLIYANNTRNVYRARPLDLVEPEKRKTIVFVGRNAERTLAWQALSAPEGGPVPSTKGELLRLFVEEVYREWGVTGPRIAAWALEHAGCCRISFHETLSSSSLRAGYETTAVKFNRTDWHRAFTAARLSGGQPSKLRGPGQARSLAVYIGNGIDVRFSRLASLFLHVDRQRREAKQNVAALQSKVIIPFDRWQVTKGRRRRSKPLAYADWLALPTLHDPWWRHPVVRHFSAQDQDDGEYCIDCGGDPDCYDPEHIRWPYFVEDDPRWH